MKCKYAQHSTGALNVDNQPNTCKVLSISDAPWGHKLDPTSITLPQDPSPSI